MGEELAVVASATDQPELFEVWPDEPKLVAEVREKSFLRTGKYLSKRLERVRAICLDIIFGRASGLLSDREIARKHRVSRNDFGVILDIMRQRGELEPLTKMINADLDVNTWLMGRRINEGILDGTIHPGQLPIPWLAALDKRAQRDAGIVPGTGRTEAEVEESALAAAWRTAQLARQAARAIDSESRAHGVQVPHAQHSPTADNRPATGSATGSEPFGPVLDIGRPAGDQAPGAPTSAAAPEGRGGGPLSPAAQDPRGDGSENFGP